MKEEELRKSKDSNLKDKKLCYMALFLLIGAGAIGEGANYFLGKFSVISAVFFVGALFALVACLKPKIFQIVAICLFVLALGAGMELMVFLAGVYPAKDSSDVAAWVQAVGSIVAIFAAVGIAQWQRVEQSRKNERDEHLSLQHRLTYLRAIATDAVVALEESKADLSSHVKGNAFKAELDRLTVSSRLLRDALKSNCPESVVMEVLEITRQVTYAIKALKQRNGSRQGFSKETLRRADYRFRKAKEQFQHISRELAKLERR